MANRPAPPARPTSKFALPAARWVAIGSSAACGLAIGFGTYPDAIASAGAVGLILPLVIAVVVACGLGTLWHFTLGIAAHADEPHKQALAACVGLGLSAIGCLTSAWFLTSIIGGASALQSYQLDAVANLQTAAGAVAANGAAEHQLIAALDAASNALELTANSEGSSGIKSGKSGKGVVFATLKNASANLAAVASSLKEREAERDGLLTQAGGDLADARRAIAARTPALFGESVNRAASLISAANKINLTASVSGLGIGLAKDHARAVIDQALADVADVARRVNQNRRDVSVPVYAPVGPREAVIENPPALAWVAALLIEALPMLGLGVLILLWRDERDDDEGGNAAPETLPQESPVAPRLRSRPTLAAAEPPANYH